MAETLTSARLDPAHTVAFMGAEGSNSDMACRKAHPYMVTLPCSTFEDVFDAVEEGRAVYGMIPIENSQAGRVAEIHNLLPRAGVHIVGEYFLKVEHYLLAPKGATLEGIKHVYSHPQALMQCRAHIRELKLAEHTHASTSDAAKDVAQWNDPSKAAIASVLAGKLYGLATLKEHMEDSEKNTTAFITIAKEPVDPDPEQGPVLTTLLYTVRNIPAALYKSLGGFATGGVNIVKLESYLVSAGGETSAQFVVTFEGHPDTRPVQLALQELGFYCQAVRVLGVYPADPARYAKR